MIECSHVLRETERSITCSCLSEAAGFTISIPKERCKLCTISKTKSCEKEPMLYYYLEKSLRIRLVEGECPKFQKRNPIDFGKCFDGYVDLVGKDKARTLFPIMFSAQLRRTEKMGGMPPNIIIANLVKIAKKHDMLDELEKVVNEYRSVS